MLVNLNAFAAAGAYYEELVANPPDEVEYCGIHRLGKSDYVSAPDSLSRALMFAEAQGQRLWDEIGWPTLRPALRGDIVHSNRLPLTTKPYVVTFDHVGFLTGFDHDRLYDLADGNAVTRYLDRTRCGALLPWSEAAADGLRSLFGADLPTDIEVLYPAIRPQSKVAEQSTGTVELLFVATGFYLKGGMEVLAAFNRLRNKYDVQLTMVTDIPEAARQRFSMDGVNVESPTFSREELYQQVYSEADVLVHPTHNDSFGMVLLEAMNAGLPIVSTDMFAVPEIVEDGETGFLVNRPEHCLFRPDGTPDPRWSDIEDLQRMLQDPETEIVNQLYERLAELVSNPEMRQAYGRAGRERVTGGRFSIERRNEQLGNLYETATRR